jgi:membrane protein
MVSNRDDGRVTASGRVSPHLLRLEDWRDVARGLPGEISSDNVAIVSAGIAFFAMLSVVPMLIVLVSVYGLITDPADAESQVGRLLEVLPESTTRALSTQMRPIAGYSGLGLSLGVAASGLALLWTASNGIRALMRGVAIAYESQPRRNWVKGRALSLSLTLSILVAAIVTLGVIAVLPVILDAIGLGASTRIVVLGVRWPILLVGAVLALSLLYRHAPARAAPPWRWVLPGATLATGVWLAASFGFAIYVERFGSYNETYGVLGVAVVLMLWLFMSSFCVLLGAELNDLLERYRPDGDRSSVASTRSGSPSPRRAAARRDR